MKNIYSKDDIKVITAEQLIIKRPKMFWGVDDPNHENYLSAIEKQIKRETDEDIKYFNHENWHFIGCKFDWIKSGLSKCQSLEKLFEKMHGYSEDNGAIGVRYEFLIKVSTSHLALWRKNVLNSIKGELTKDVKHALIVNYSDYITLVFKE